MINSVLQKLLQSFPAEAPIDIVPSTGGPAQELERVQLKLDDAPRTIENNLSWAEIVKDMVRVRLVCKDRVKPPTDGRP